MRTSPQKIVVGLLVTGVVLFIAWLVLFAGPISHPVKNSVLLQEIKGIRQICTTLRFYVEEHPQFVGRYDRSNGFDALVAAGILSPSNVAYVRDHHIEFHGFDTARIGGDVPVLETRVKVGTSFRRIVGYSDGSVVTYNIEDTK